MIAANYTAALYCDGPHPKYSIPHIEAIAESWAGAKREAKKSGWTISSDRQLAYCPDCRKKNYHRGMNNYGNRMPLPAPPAEIKGEDGK